MTDEFLIGEYKKRLGEKADTLVIPYGRETFAINTYENGFVLRKRGQTIVLDLVNLFALKDSINRFIERRAILKSL